MAIITEHEDDVVTPKPQPNLRSRTSKNTKPKPASAAAAPKPAPIPNPKKPNQNPNPFTFWFYFTVAVSLITLVFVFVSYLTPQDSRAWFLSLPSTLREHYSSGRNVKVQLNPNGSPIEVFTYSVGSKSSENVLIVHGLGCSSFTFRKVADHLASKGVFATAVDLPGSGFSDKATMVERETSRGVFGGFWDMYDEIKEKGLFWGFDNLVENGYIPYEESSKARVSTRKSLEPLELGSQEVGRVLGQVIDSMGLAPLHLVLHDSALVMGASWVSENAGVLRSVTLIDTMPRGTALPLWALELPLVREMVLGFESVFGRIVDLCCSKSVESSSLDAHRILLRAANARQTIVGMGKKLNYSFNLEDWASSDRVRGMPMQVLWSSSWSKEWTEEGHKVAGAIPQASFATHSGGRWPQEMASVEVADKILSFVSSLPKTDRKAEEEPIPEHIQMRLDEAKAKGHHHHHDHDGHAHAHAGYTEGYGLGHGWDA